MIRASGVFSEPYQSAIPNTWKELTRWRSQ